MKDCVHPSYQGLGTPYPWNSDSGDTPNSQPLSNFFGQSFWGTGSKCCRVDCWCILAENQVHLSEVEPMPINHRSVPLTDWLRSPGLRADNEILLLGESPRVTRRLRLARFQERARERERDRQTEYLWGNSKYSCSHDVGNAPCGLWTRGWTMIERGWGPWIVLE